jgi:hypothetical protein
MDTNQILSLARTQLQTLVASTSDEEATVRLSLALSALGEPVATSGDLPALGTLTVHVVDHNADEGSDEPGGEYVPFGAVGVDDDGQPVGDEAAFVAQANARLNGGGYDVDDEDEETYDDEAEADGYDGEQPEGLVYGGRVGVDDEGNEVGDREAMVARANARVADEDEDCGGCGGECCGGGQAADPATEFRVTYTRDDGPLSADDVRMIVDSQASQPLRMLGNIESMRIENGDDEAQKVAVFRFGGEGLDLETIRRGFVRYRGTKVLPGIGRVHAEGSAA